MPEKLKTLSFFLIGLCLSVKIFAQADTLHHAPDSIRPLRIAVFVPLYIDSAFNDYTYKLSSTSLPKYMLPGLDFYNGVMLAIDSLQKEKANIDVWVYDTKKKGQNSAALMAEIDTVGFSLIIASFNSIAEQKTLSSFAFTKNIPLISATYPNDAYVTGNPFFIMINPTLKTHIESIYKYVLRNYPVGRILFITRRGMVEDKIRDGFIAMEKKTAAMKYTITEMPDNFTSADIAPLMDSTKQNVIICGSVNENFGINLVRSLSGTALAYEPVVIGMPTWDGLKALSGDDCINVPIFYSTPYHFLRTDKVIVSIAKAYKAKYAGRPADMAFKGFESMYHFTKLLQKHPNDFINNISDTSYKISDDFIFEPVKNNPASQVPDYLENKKIYFVQQLNGVIKPVTANF